MSRGANIPSGYFCVKANLRGRGCPASGIPSRAGDRARVTLLMARGRAVLGEHT
jgi:hypothetical protein